MSITERLSDAGLLAEFDSAVAERRRDEFESVLRKLQCSDEEVERLWQWVWHAPHSPHNTDPVVLDPLLAADARMATLSDRSKRIIQFLFEAYGGQGPDSCVWSGCERRALKRLAYCAYCAFEHANVSSGPITKG